MMSAIGDAVHVLPVVTALKRHDPGCRISWLLQPAPASLVRGHPAVDEILEFDPRRGSGEWARLRRELAARRFDLVLDLQVALKAGLATALTRAPRKLGFDRARARDLNWLFTTERIPARPAQHVQDQYFEFLEHLGVPHEPVEWGIGPWPEERAAQAEFLRRFDRPIAAINLATSNPDRDWRPERGAEVTDALQERYGLQPVLVGGASERERALEAAVRAAARTPPASALGSGLRPLVGILDAASLVIALDSAPLHLAVAVGTPVISLMSNADPRRTGPYRAFGDLIVDAYHEPGEEAPVSMARRPGRMGRIRVEDVLERVERWRERYAERGRTGEAEEGS
jgi:heptosyltransferase I